ncbi:alpha/beta fold hydrolase [Kribbella sp. C-35]|uniref:alpha/beta fold hydrolase n=1 Tax=Kribbella sp. C-35 TaxID=2789276 RepID=UPI00397D30FE
MHPENQPADQRPTRTVCVEPAYDSYAGRYDDLLDEYGVTADVSCPAVGSTGRVFVAQVGAGDPVVFLHGTPATSAVWIPLAARLRGVRAYLVDRPGHGLSGSVDYAEVSDLRAHAVAFVDALLDTLGLERAVLAGNSMGGLWALWSALDLPGRVSAVAAIGAPPGLLAPRLPRIFGPLSVPWMAKVLRRLDPPSPRSTRRFFRLMGDPPAQLSDSMVDVFTEGLRLPNAEGGMSHMIQHFVAWPGRFADRRLWLSADELGEIQQRVLLVWGRHDFLGDLTVAQCAAGAFPRAVVVEAGVGHLPWLQDPQVVADTLGSFVRR